MVNSTLIFLIAVMLLLGTVLLATFASWSEARDAEREELNHRIELLQAMNDSLMVRNDVLRREKAIYKALTYKAAEEQTDCADMTTAVPEEENAVPRVCNGVVETRPNMLFMYAVKR